MPGDHAFEFPHHAAPICDWDQRIAMGEVIQFRNATLQPRYFVLKPRYFFQ
ncbi:hypothetical protein [Sphingomonas xanthus]|uniref:hypothetical protein n=1 Tax=Sphingomonas xanthus TaxID=2594473 RepID=UPI001FE8D469|nr:hypothetical protein [Sphingomonas xanthus]